MPMENFKQMLKQKGLKSTSQRMSILKSIEEAVHIDIEALYKSLSVNNPSISLNTVYLNIEQLSKEGLISKVALNSQKSVYEITKKEHIHLVCKVCGDICDEQFNDEAFKVIAEGLGGTDFEASFVALNVYGVCKKCKTKINNKERK